MRVCKLRINAGGEPVRTVTTHPDLKIAGLNTTSSVCLDRHQAGILNLAIPDGVDRPARVRSRAAALSTPSPSSDHHAVPGEQHHPRLRTTTFSEQQGTSWCREVALDCKSK